MDRPPQRRRLPFPVKKYVWPFLSASIAMFSLLLTHQLIWRAFFDLSWRLSPPDFWLTATALEPRPKPLSPSFSPYRILTTNNSNLTLELLSPPDRQLTVSVNGSPIHVSTRATGNSTLDVALRRGSNNIEAKLSPDLANPYSFHGPDYVSLRVVYHAAQVTPPWILGGQSRKLRGYETPGAYIYGFGEPESDVSLSTGPNTQTDRVGFFSSFQFSRENKKSLGVTVRTTLPT